LIDKIVSHLSSNQPAERTIERFIGLLVLLEATEGTLVTEGQDDGEIETRVRVGTIGRAETQIGYAASATELARQANNDISIIAVPRALQGNEDDVRHLPGPRRQSAGSVDHLKKGKSEEDPGAQGWTSQ